MGECGGMLCRDEMIVGPLSLPDDTDTGSARVMMSRIASLRGKSTKRLDAAVSALAKQRKTQINTLENYTRFPLAVLQWTGWTAKVRDSGGYGRPIVFHRLTDQGRELLALLNQAQDLRASMLSGATPAIREATAKLGAISILERAGFDSSNLSADRAGWVRALVSAKLLSSNSTPLIFSPFQELSQKETSAIFGSVGRVSPTMKAGAPGVPTLAVSGRAPAPKTIGRVPKKASLPVATSVAQTPVERILRAALGKGLTSERAAGQLVTLFESANKAEFYPAVCQLFRILGYDCSTSRVGVNYQRWDAFITHPTDSVPIEIKSPAEELFVSVKGVRQALENKVILLARQAAQTRRETTSLVVGLLAPNDRAEVAELIADIHAAFGIRIGVIDFRSLALLAAGALQGSKAEAETLFALKGFLNVAAA
jgi:hypothetical protein